LDFAFAAVLVFVFVLVFAMTQGAAPRQVWALRLPSHPLIGSLDDRFSAGER
jgi:hypothetical protein